MAKPEPVAIVHQAECGLVTCRACGQPRDLDEYRFFKTQPEKQYMDFCLPCELAEGTINLYRRFSGYGTPEIVQAIYAAERTPEIRRSEEQIRLLVRKRSVKPPETNEEVVKRELARREMARRRLLVFTKMFKPDYMAGWVHQDICRQLERFVEQVELGLSPRLMLFLPPRAGKSLLASDMFPSWALGKHPEWAIMATSYAQSLPLGFSREVRNRLRDPEFGAVFPQTRMSADSTGIEAWHTTKGGGYIAAGIGTGITGKGFNIGIVDDPVKDQEAADSDVQQEATYAWYQSTFMSRKAPGAGVLIIQTRWKWTDLSGKLIDHETVLEKAGVPEYERENWKVVSYPALAESDEYLMRDGSIEQSNEVDETKVLKLLRRKGEALHPERYSTADMRRTKNSMSSSIWNALYQQKPTPDEGDFFNKKDFRYRFLPIEYRPLARRFLCVDYAIKKGNRNDFTVMGVFALDSNDDLYLFDVARGRWGTDDIARNAVALVKKHSPEIYAGEQGQIHAAVWPVINKALVKERLFITVDDTLVPLVDKEARARAFQARVQQHKFFFSHDTVDKPAEYEVMESEMLQFPNGVYDDTVDVGAWGARLALNISLPATRSPPKPKSFRDELAALARGDSVHDHMSA